MGIDSLMSVGLRNKLSKALGIKLSSTLLFNYTNVSVLAGHLHQLINQNFGKISEIKSPKIISIEVSKKVVTSSRVQDQ
jgi:Phosphopantetheine attachment site